MLPSHKLKKLLNLGILEEEEFNNIYKSKSNSESDEEPKKKRKAPAKKRKSKKSNFPNMGPIFTYWLKIGKYQDNELSEVEEEEEEENTVDPADIAFLHEYKVRNFNEFF